MIDKLKNAIIQELINIPGFRTNRKIVIFESDDWGYIRMPSKKVYNQLLTDDIRVDNCPYNRYDSLASEDDLTFLFFHPSSCRRSVCFYFEFVGPYVRIQPYIGRTDNTHDD